MNEDELKLIVRHYDALLKKVRIFEESQEFRQIDKKICEDNLLHK